MSQKTVNSTKCSGSSVQDAISAEHNNSALTDTQNASVRQALKHCYAAIGGDNVQLGKTITASYNVSATSCTVFVNAT